MFEGSHSALFRWKTLKKSVADAVKVLNKIRNLSQDQKVLRAKLRKCIPDIVFAYIYPRLDADVSKHQNHLLKSPFCVHPKTGADCPCKVPDVWCLPLLGAGKVCIPMDPAAIDDFDPMDVPNVYQLAASFTETKDQLAGTATIAPCSSRCLRLTDGVPCSSEALNLGPTRSALQKTFPRRIAPGERCSKAPGG